MSANQPDWADIIGALNGQKGWTQAELAKQAGCRPGTVGDILKGKTRPKTPTLSGLARAFQLKVPKGKSPAEILISARDDLRARQAPDRRSISEASTERRVTDARLGLSLETSEDIDRSLVAAELMARRIASFLQELRAARQDRAPHNGVAERRDNGGGHDR